MVQKTSPFVESKYGWDFGESGWNLGMDENLLKFSFLFDRNIDGIVDTLPPAVNGKAYYLTTDRRVYFVIGGSYYSTPLPKWFSVFERVSGVVWQFNGASIEQVPERDDLLRQDLADPTDPAKGADLVGFVPGGGGAVPRTVLDKLRESVSVLDFGAIGDGVADDTAAVQAAIEHAKTLKGEVFFPAGDYKITGVNVDGPVKLSGVDASSTGSRVFIVGDAPAFNVTAACTFDGIAIYGEGDVAKTNQHGVKITSVNDVYMRNIFFDNCYDCVHIFGEVFYTYLDGCRWYRSVNTMVYAEGNTAPGFAIQILNCQATPPSGNRGFVFKNFGSVIIDSLMLSPNTLTNEAIVFDTAASAAGISQINNTVIEGSDGVPLKMVGTSGASQAKFLFCSNSYFGCGSTLPVVELTDVRGAYFSNCYFTGSGDGFLLNGTVNSVHITDGDFQVLSVPILAGAASVVSGLYLTNPDYQGVGVFMDLNSASFKQNISVVGGTIGSNSNPIQPASVAGLYARLPGVTKYKNGGVATFNGGTSTFTIAHGLVSTPRLFTAVPNSLDAGVAEIREVTVDAAHITVQCKAAAGAGTGNVKWAWIAEI